MRSKPHADLQPFLARLDIMKRWAIAQHHRSAASPGSTEGGSAPAMAAEAPHADDVAIVKARRPSLEEIDDALQRIARGRYGLCTHCERPIGHDRMLVQPTAIRCAACDTGHPR